MVVDQVGSFVARRGMDEEGCRPGHAPNPGRLTRLYRGCKTRPAGVRADLARVESGRTIISTKDRVMRLTQFFIEQSRNPSGLVGKLLLNAMDMAHGKVIEKALEPVHNKGDHQVLDIGCGSGYALKIMSSRFHHSDLHGIDISETCVKIAKLKNKKALNNNSFDIRTGDVADLPYADDSMDIVTAFQTHYFWPDIKQAFREIHRVLQPGGLFILCGDLYKMKYHLTKYQSMEEYPQLLKEWKFSEIDVFPYLGFMVSYSKKCA